MMDSMKLTSVMASCPVHHRSFGRSMVDMKGGPDMGISEDTWGYSFKGMGTVDLPGIICHGV